MSVRLCIPQITLTANRLPVRDNLVAIMIRVCAGVPAPQIG